MPGMNGFECAKLLRECESSSRRPEATGSDMDVDPKMMIFCVTASDTEDARQKATDSGMDGFIAKPLTLSAIDAQLEMLNEKRLQQ